ncbi:MAG: PilZ domain-containing protein [Deltaproteobacteria bacterium]|nr:PilZ domain-containing protein [Deltaproteobacteria bacterium]
MANIPSVLILDDGELDDVQRILEELEVEFGRVQGGAIAPNTPHPKSLLMATPRRISAVAAIDEASADEDPPVRVVVVDQDSKTLRDQLRQVGFDFLVRRPVHPEALRLLVMHSLYRGDEKRREPRVAVGLEISFQTGEIPRRATLVDLSTGGCRLISPFEIEAGKLVLVTLPESLGAAEAITLDGRILRSSYDKRIGEEGMYSAAVQFENLSSDLRNELEWIIEDKVGGPPALNTTLKPTQGEAGADPSAPGAKPTYTLKRGEQQRHPVRKALLEKESPALKADPRCEGAASASTSSAASAAAGEQEHYPLSVPVDVKMARPEKTVQEPVEEIAAQPPVRPIAQPVEPIAQPVEPIGQSVEPVEQAPSISADDRRATPRHPYAAKVPAFGTRALRVLVGRDLSVGGMQIESNPDLEVGDRLHLAIYGDASEEPFLVWGTILRSDGRGGTAVAFDPVHPTIAKQLEALVASLPAVESLQDTEAEAMGTVLTEIINE